jgi:hypothetical protein
MLRELLAVSVLVSLGQDSAPAIREPRTSPDNPIAHEPLLVYEVTGGTLVGPYDLQLTVYADGLARLASATQTKLGRTVLRDVGPDAAHQLATELARAGAFFGGDQTQIVTDMPLSTLTILQGAPDSRAHTYSWWVPEGSNQTAPALLQSFIADNFADF